MHKAGPEGRNNPEQGNILQAAVKLPLLTEGMTLSKNNLLSSAWPWLHVRTQTETERHLINIRAWQRGGHFHLRFIIRAIINSEKRPCFFHVSVESKREINKKNKTTKFGSDFNSVKIH